MPGPVNQSARERLTGEVRQLWNEDNTQVVCLQGTHEGEVYFQFGEEMDAAENLYLIPGYRLSENDKLWLRTPANEDMDMPRAFFEAFVAKHKFVTQEGPPPGLSNTSEVDDEVPYVFKKVSNDTYDAVYEPIDPNMIAALQEMMNALHALVEEDASFGILQTKLQQAAAHEGITLDVPHETHVVTPSHASPATTAMVAPLPVPLSLEEHLELLEKLQKKLLDLNNDHYLTIPESVEPVLMELHKKVQYSIRIVRQDLAMIKERQTQADARSTNGGLFANDGNSIISELTQDEGDVSENDSHNNTPSNFN